MPLASLSCNGVWNGAALPQPVHPWSPIAQQQHFSCYGLGPLGAGAPLTRVGSLRRAQRARPREREQREEETMGDATKPRVDVSRLSVAGCLALSRGQEIMQSQLTLHVV